MLESGVIVPGKPGESELIRRLVTDDPDEHMPPIDTNLVVHPNQLAQIKRWIEAGARWTGHWAYEPLIRPVAPQGVSAATAYNAIDRFVQAKLRDNMMSPAPEASRERLIRRVTLDLTGLPPTLSELDSFLHDTSPNAYELVVDRLLASAAFGERMAWPWLDAARYADSNGFQGDRERTMWPWRDWVVNAINQNMPFDEFTVLQLAGDQLPNASDAERLATGFCRNHMINGEGGRIPAENRVEYIFDQIETVGTIWLGMTMQCCRCHDHKFDPVSQDEYYKLFAFFNQTPVNGAGGDPQTAPVVAVPDRAERLANAKWTAAIQKFAASVRCMKASRRI